LFLTFKTKRIKEIFGLFYIFIMCDIINTLEVKKNMAEAISKWGPQPLSSIAISHSDYDEFGCPVCLTREKRATPLIQVPGATAVSCGNCETGYVIVRNGLTHSPLGMSGKKPGEIEVVSHPSHGLGCFTTVKLRLVNPS